jgi:hypothetical protein
MGVGTEANGLYRHVGTPPPVVRRVPTNRHRVAGNIDM